MKHVVEYFDGRDIRGLLIDKKYLSGFLSRVENLDPALGAVVLEITPERIWHANRRRNRAQWSPQSGIDRERQIRVDQFLV